ncbi:hypothetical protein FQA39_LY04651 [Lamprigera yunnana]|nr:hypothetical protein FQA39_LY04651 [Lamprigera yunnana]
MNSTSPDTVFQILKWVGNTVFHQCVAVLAIYVIWIPIVNYSTPFSWHVILCTLGVFPLMAEALILFSPSNVWSQEIERKKKYWIHAILMSLAIFLEIVGIGIEIHRQTKVPNILHFQSAHSRFGLSSLVFTIFTLVSGLLAFNTSIVQKWAPPVWYKLGHNILGQLMYVFCIISLVLVASVATSCLQLAKERIIKSSDRKYNINDFKTEDCETMLLNQRIYYLNKSKKEEWIQFHEQRENINKYFQTCDMMWKPKQIGSKTLTFEMIEEKKILRIENVCGNEVYLGWESVSEVWSLQTVLSYRLSYSSGSNFKYFYDDVIRAVAETSGDVKINIYNIVNRLSEKSDDVCCMLEVLHFMPEKALFDVQLERRIQ